MSGKKSARLMNQEIMNSAEEVQKELATAKTMDDYFRQRRHIYPSYNIAKCNIISEEPETPYAPHKAFLKYHSQDWVSYAE